MISLPLGAEEAVAEEVVAVVIEVVEAVASEGAEASEEAEVVIEVAEVVAVEVVSEEEVATEAEEEALSHQSQEWLSAKETLKCCDLIAGEYHYNFL